MDSKQNLWQKYGLHVDTTQPVPDFYDTGGYMQEKYASGKPAIEDLETFLYP